MKKPPAVIAEPPEAPPAQSLLEGLIGECHAIIREVLLPAARQSDHDDRRDYVASIASLMDSAVRLGDAVGRLRGTAPRPEIRQRITVEKLQRLAGPGAP